MIRHLSFPNIIEHNAPFTSVVMDDRYAFVAGVVAADFPAGRAVLGNAGDETHEVMSVINLILDECGLDLSDVVRVDVHLADLDDFDAMNDVYATFFSPGRYPARTCVQSEKLFGGSLVEITCVARLRS
ncbi:MAG: RidA family protein [Pseudomonadota bacterium]